MFKASCPAATAESGSTYPVNSARRGRLAIDDLPFSLGREENFLGPVGELLAAQENCDLHRKFQSPSTRSGRTTMAPAVWTAVR